MFLKLKFEAEASKALTPLEEQMLKLKLASGMTSGNVIIQLQEIAQQAKVKLPSYGPRGSHPNFECLCRFKFLGEHRPVKG